MHSTLNSYRYYLISLAICVANLFLWSKFRPRYEGLIFKDLWNFRKLSLKIFFICSILFGIVCIESANTILFVMYGLHTMTMDQVFYFVFSGAIFGILGICVNIYAKKYLVSNTSLGDANLAKNTTTNPNNIFTAIFCALGIKSLWDYVMLFIVMLGSNGLSGSLSLYLVETEYWKYWLSIFCVMAFIGFIIIFKLNSLISQYTQKKLISFAMDFMSLALLVCSVIIGVHCIFGVDSDFLGSEVAGFVDYNFTVNTNEQYAYSASLVCVSIALLILGILKNIERFKHYCFALLLFVALKVFFINTSSFSSLSKIALFVFMGIVFIGISIAYSRFVLKRTK